MSYTGSVLLATVMALIMVGEIMSGFSSDNLLMVSECHEPGKSFSAFARMAADTACLASL